MGNVLVHFSQHDFKALCHASNSPQMPQSLAAPEPGSLAKLLERQAGCSHRRRQLLQGLHLLRRPHQLTQLLDHRRQRRTGVARRSGGGTITAHQHLGHIGGNDAFAVAQDIQDAMGALGVAHPRLVVDGAGVQALQPSGDTQFNEGRRLSHPGVMGGHILGFAIHGQGRRPQGRDRRSEPLQAALERLRLCRRDGVKAVDSGRDQALGLGHAVLVAGGNEVFHPPGSPVDRGQNFRGMAGGIHRTYHASQAVEVHERYRQHQQHQCGNRQADPDRNGPGRG